MERYKNRSGVEHIMKRNVGISIRIVFIVATIISLCVIVMCPATLQAQAQRSANADAAGSNAGESDDNAALFEGILVNQAGSSLLLIEIKGINLPYPKVLRADPGRMVLFFSNTVIPAETWSRSYNFPLLSGVEVANVEGGLEVRLLTTQTLEIKELTGTPPAPLYRLHLAPPKSEVVQEPPKKKEGPLSLALKTGPRDPMAMTIPVTLEMRDAELKDVLRMLAKFMNLNVIIDPSVPPTTVSISVRNAPLPEVLGYVMRMHNITYALMDNTILFGTADSLGKSLGLEQTRAFRIAYADPKQIPPILQSLVGVSGIAVDERLRMIYITGRPDNLRDAEALLQRIDHPGRQVMLQARLIEVRDTGKKELESIVDAVYKHWR